MLFSDLILLFCFVGKAADPLMFHFPFVKWATAVLAEPNNLAYMVRLSNAGFPSMRELITYLRG